MKKTSTLQANRRFHSKHQRATHGMYTSLRIFLLILLCGCISTGTVAWSQTRSTSTSSSRSSSRTTSASDARTEKKAADSRTEKKATETRSSDSKAKAETTSKQESTRNQASARNQETPRKQESTRNQETDDRREPSTRSESVQQPAVRQSGNARQVQATEGRNANTRGADIRDAGTPSRSNPQIDDRRGGRSENARVAPTTRLSSGYRLTPGSRTPDRNKFQLPDIRFKRDHERCVLCFGVGFVYTHDRLHRLRCSHCYGRGFELEFISQLDDVCPICYGPVSGYHPLQRRSIQNTANYVIDRLDYILDLSRSQERAIKRIVLDYLRDSRYEGWYNPVVVRDRAIMRALSYRQRDIYMDFMNNVDSRDLCDRCFDYF